MGVDILKIISVFLLSTVKFALAVPAASAANFSFVKTVFVCSAGGAVGIITFTYLSEWINGRIKKTSSSTEVKKNKNKFTFTNKLIIKVKKYFGLLGIAAITPILLSIPIGVFLAVRYYKHKAQIISYMLASVVFWSMAMYFLVHGFRSLF